MTPVLVVSLELRRDSLLLQSMGPRFRMDDYHASYFPPASA